MNERFEKVNNLLNIFCKEQISEETVLKDKTNKTHRRA